MGLRINQNIAALVAARALQAKQKALANSVEKLSTGQRVNSGADDPAGLVISENLRAQTDSLDRNIQSNQNKVNQLRTEDAKLGETFNQLHAIRDRALEALNTGATDQAARTANQTSARSSVDSVSRTLRGVDSSGLAEIGRSLEDIDLSTSDGAQQALDTVDSAIEELSTFRGNLGSHQTNTLEADIRRESVEAENLRASESAIRDTDFAETTVDFVKNRVLLEVNVAALVQAKKSSQSALQIIKSSGVSSGESGSRGLLGIA
ncbi:MAG: flagellin [Nitrospinota bacterium]|jgi:flagellin|nr:flagellin [Nitrospinota bacterium]MDP7167315.1 flagellin [Nitrospinota bacterium]MDP7370454.1 flagellin [Nitrospinota bacterium]MDP7503174.1 flagellin [Nitrospinota bacterium]MDP7662641.1 flagellin [Nitrospinota bacterium]